MEWIIIPATLVPLAACVAGWFYGLHVAAQLREDARHD